MPEAKTGMSKPQRASSRLVALDVARALALLGIIVVHVLGPRGTSGAMPAGFILGNSVAPALFALLSGTSLALASGGAKLLPRGQQRRQFILGTVVRGLFIAMVGVALAGLGSGIAVILTYFGALFLVAIPFLWLRVRTLLIVSAVLATAGATATFFLRPHLPPRVYDAPLWEDFTRPWELVTHLLFTGYYPVSAWLVYLLAGLAIGRLDLQHTRNQLWLMGGGLAVALPAWLAARLALSTTALQERLLAGQTEASWPALQERITPGLYGAPPVDGDPAWLLVAVPHAGTPLDLLATVGISLAVVGALLYCCSLLARWPVALEALRIGFGAGTMTLTLYSLHVLMHSPVLPPKDTPSTFGLHVWVVLTLGAIFALLRKRGPLEYVAGLIVRQSPPKADLPKSR